MDIGGGLGTSEVEAGRGACSLVVGGWDRAAGDGDLK